jgi:hypothetical protein
LWVAAILLGLVPVMGFAQLTQEPFRIDVKNVLSPDDIIVPRNANSPANQGADKAIDGSTDTKFVDSDKAYTGFTVTPKGGATVVTAISLTYASDAPERDPANFVLYGSLDGSAFEVIIMGNLNSNPARLSTETIRFDNTKAYTSYQVLFPNVANPANANAMQIAEVALLSSVSIGDASRALNGFVGLPYSSAEGSPWVLLTGGTGDTVDGLGLRSAQIDHNGISSFEIPGVPGPQTVTWQAFVSSEQNYDYLKFYVDGSEVTSHRKSGQGGGWTSHSQELPAGKHTLRWVYSKDHSIVGGLDYAGLDSVVFTYPPVLARSPSGAAVNPGETLRLTAVGGGGPGTSVVWRRTTAAGTTVLSNGGRISGATGLELVITGAQPSDAGTYTVQLNNWAGTVTSANAVVSVEPQPPSITSVTPANATLFQGEALDLSVVAAGTPPLSFQWFRNGTAIPGATTASYSIASIALSQAGTYTVSVNNAQGSATSSGIPVVVKTSRFAFDASRALNGFVGLPYTSAEGSPWIVWPDGGDGMALRSAPIPNSATSSFEIPGVPGPQTVTWKAWVRSESGFDFLKFYVDGSEVTSHRKSGSTDGWTSHSQELPAGTHTLKWAYSKDYSESVSPDMAGLDSVVFTYPPVLETSPSGTAVNPGDTLRLTAVGGGGPGTSVVWRRTTAAGTTVLSNGGRISGATGLELVITGAQPSDVGTYTVQLNNWAGTVTSANADVTILQPPSITSVTPANATLVPGQALNLNVVAAGTPPLFYQWFRNGTAIAGATTASYSIASIALSQAGTYTVRVNNAQGQTTSSGIPVVVQGTPQITAQPANRTAAIGKTVRLTVSVTSSLQPVTYAWRRGGVPLVSGGRLSGTSSGELTILDVQPADAGSYTVEVSNAAGSVTSTAATLTVVPFNLAPTLASIPALTRLEDAAASTVNLSGIDDGNAGLAQGLTVTAVSSNPSVVPHPTVTYTSPQAVGTLSVTGAPGRSGTATITVKVQDDGGTVDGGVDTVERQFVVTVTAVNDPPTLNLPANVTMSDTGAALPGAANTTPRTVTLTGISDGDSPNFVGLTLSATSGNPSVLGNPTITYSGGPTAVLSLPVPALHSNATVPITVRLRDSDGTANGGVDVIERTFNVQVVAINDPPTIAPIANLNIADTAGEQTVTLTGLSDGDAGGQSLTITATSSHPSIVTVSPVAFVGPSSPLRFSPVVGAVGTATVTVTVKDNGGTANGGVDTTTRTFVVRVGPVPPEIEVAPADQIVELGQPATFEVVASGIGLTYKWFKDGVEIPGATSRSLQIQSVDNAGAYRVNVYNANPEQIYRTAVAVLTVVGPPVRSVVLPTQQAEFTSVLYLSAGVTATRQWLKDGQPVPGATGASLVIPSATRDSVGDYSIKINVGSVEYISPPVTLRLRTPLVTLFSTGLDDRRVRLTDRAEDPHYTLVSPSPVTGKAVSVVLTPGQYPSSEWIVGGANSAWLSPSTRLREPGSNYVYRTTFDLTGVELNSVEMAGSIAADDTVTAIRLNGVALEGVPTGIGSRGYSTFQFSLTNRRGGDRFMDRARLPSVAVVAATGNTIGSGRDPDERLVYDSNIHGTVNSVWWSWVAPSSGTYSVRSTGSAIPVILAVWDGRAVSRLNSLGGDGGLGRDTNTLRRVDFTAVAGREYQISVDGYGEARGVVGIDIRPLGSTATATSADALPSVLPGINLLEFVVRNTADPGSDRGLTGLRVEFTRADAVIHPPTVGTEPVGGIQIYGGRKEFAVSGRFDPGSTFQWYRGNTLIEGATEPSLLFNRVEDFDAGSYRVRIENANGVAWSQPAEFLVDLPLTITRQPVDQSVPVGGTAQFSVRFRGNAPLAVQWFLNDQPIAGATSTNLTRVAVGPADAGLYRAVVRDRDGSRDSEPARLVVVEPPLIVQEPQDLVGVERRDTMRLYSVVDGSLPLRLRWFRNGIPLAVPDTNVLDLGLLRESHAGDYHFVAANLAGSVTSRVASVSVNHPPSLVSGSDDVKADVGGSARFTVRASGTGLLSYLWYLDGVFLAGEDTASLELKDLTARTESQVAVVVVNDFGRITNRFRLDVFPPPVPVVSTGHDIVQEVRLKPGWNAFFLQVQPADNLVSRVFNNVPYTSVWRWSDPGSGPQYISEQSEANLDTTQWQVHLPPDHPGKFQNNLIRVFRHEAYIVHLGGAQEVTLSIAGKPGYQRARWATDGYTLTGFPVVPAAANPLNPGQFLLGVTAREFLGSSAAHYDTAADAPRGLYRLGADGAWTRLGAADELRPGEAYWVYTRGSSRFVAPFELSFSGGTEITYGVGGDVQELQLQFPEPSPSERIRPTASLGHLLEDQALPLRIAEFDPQAATTWRDLPNGFGISPQVGSRKTLRLAAARSRIPGLVYQGVLKVQSGATLHRIPITVDRDESNVAAVEGTPFNPVGLWQGTVSITHVSEVNGLTTNYVVNLVTNVVDGVTRIVEIPSTEVRNVSVGSRPTPVRDPFDLPILLHADTNGVLRLLQQVTLMSTPPALGSSNPGGEPVLLTDSSTFSRYRGVSMRGRDLVGRRFSTPFFPMVRTNGIPFDGTLALGATVSATWALPADAAINPFKHRYHPDHDNLDTSFRVYREEAYPVRRTVRLTIPEGQGSTTNPAMGQEEIEGIYEESVDGLHRTTITARGSFQLKRILAVGALDPSTP